MKNGDGDQQGQDPSVPGDDIPIEQAPEAQKGDEEKGSEDPTRQLDSTNENRQPDQPVGIEQNPSPMVSQGNKVARTSPQAGLQKPGAVAVRGPYHREGSSVSDAPVADVRNLEEADSPLEAYTVDDQDGNKVAAQPDNYRRSMLIAVIVIAIILVAVCVPVGMKYSDGETAVQEELMVAFTHTGVDDGSFVTGRKWKAVIDGEEVYRIEGSRVSLYCIIPDCKENDGACQIGGYYEEGCCMGKDCPEETKCGEFCPRDPVTEEFACQPQFDGCISKECYTCKNGPNGQAGFFQMVEDVNDIICIDQGKSLDAEGNSYNWVVYCSRVVTGGRENENRDHGEYTCNALREKSSFPDTFNSHNLPCQYIQLGECGCAPLDIHPFDLDPPTKSCQTQNDCPFLCSDVPESDPQLLCEAFGGTSWFSGDNFMDYDLFYNVTEEAADPSQPNNLEINIFD